MHKLVLVLAGYACFNSLYYTFRLHNAILFDPASPQVKRGKNIPVYIYVYIYNLGDQSHQACYSLTHTRNPK